MGSKAALGILLFSVLTCFTTGEDDWFELFREADLKSGHTCPKGDGEYPDPYSTDRYYTCANVSGRSAFSKGYGCPLGLCYNGSNPTKCDSESCHPPDTLMMDDPFPCNQDRGGEIQIPSLDPTVLYRCKVNALGYFTFSSAMRCMYNTCATLSNSWPCAEGYPHCLPKPTQPQDSPMQIGDEVDSTVDPGCQVGSEYMQWDDQIILSSLLHGEQRNGVTRWQQRWPEGRIPFILHKNLDPIVKFLIGKAIEEFHNKTCIQFIPYKKGMTDFVVIKDCGACSSSVGRKGGPQVLSLGPSCNTLGRVLHELNHAIGFWHEHSRSDRDQFLIIHPEHIKEGKEHNFIQLKEEDNTILLPFEVNSIMMYPNNAFSKDGQWTMEHRGGTRLPDITTWIALAETDVKRINYLYECHHP